MGTMEHTSPSVTPQQWATTPPHTPLGAAQVSSHPNITYQLQMTPGAPSCCLTPGCPYVAMDQATAAAVGGAGHCQRCITLALQQRAAPVLQQGGGGAAAVHDAQSQGQQQPWQIQQPRRVRRARRTAQLNLSSPVVSPAQSPQLSWQRSCNVPSVTTPPAPNAADGEWYMGSTYRGLIHGKNLHWPSGEVSPLEGNEQGFRMIYDGHLIAGWLTAAGGLQWSDGEIWTRQQHRTAAVPGVGQASPSLSYQSPSPALPPAQHGMMMQSMACQAAPSSSSSSSWSLASRADDCSSSFSSSSSSEMDHDPPKGEVPAPFIFWGDAIPSSPDSDDDHPMLGSETEGDDFSQSTGGGFGGAQPGITDWSSLRGNPVVTTDHGGFGSTGGGGGTVDHRSALIALYQRVAPSKLNTVDAILAKYKGNEEKLWAMLKKKYGAGAQPPSSASEAQLRLALQQETARRISAEQALLQATHEAALNEL